MNNEQNELCGGDFKETLSPSVNRGLTPNQIKGKYLWARALELGEEEYPRLPYAKWAEQFGREKPPYGVYWEWVASQLTSYTAVVNCLVNHDPVQHSIRFIEAVDVVDARTVALEDEIAERRSHPIIREGGYKPEHFRVVAIFAGNIPHLYFRFS